MRMGRCCEEQHGGKNLHLETGRMFNWEYSSPWLGKVDGSACGTVGGGEVLDTGILGAARGKDMHPREYLTTRFPGTKDYHLPASSRQTNCTTILAAMVWVVDDGGCDLPGGRWFRP